MRCAGSVRVNPPLQRGHASSGGAPPALAARRWRRRSARIQAMLARIGVTDRCAREFSPYIRQPPFAIAGGSAELAAGVDGEGRLPDVRGELPSAPIGYANARK